MKVIKAHYDILNPNLNDPAAVSDIYKRIELAGRTCYKSENKITDESAAIFVRKLIESGHEAMIEHAGMTVRFVVDRGISHELVRHRIASFAQESTRYCNYSKDKFGGEIVVIEPCFFNDIPDEDKQEMQESIKNNSFYAYRELQGSHEGSDKVNKINQYFNWYSACYGAENSYFTMLDWGATPQEARAVLPTSLKTEVIMTANMREWRHFFKLRSSEKYGKPHPQMLEIASALLKECKEKMPELFFDC